MLNDFRTFISRGNVFDLAVAVVIGAAFAAVVDSFVKDVLMPPIGVVTGGVDFSELYLPLSGARYPTLAAADEAGAPVLRYGQFLNQLVSFVIVAFSVFLLIRQYALFRARGEVVPAGPTEQECPYCRLAIPLAATRCAHCTSELSTQPL